MCTAVRYPLASFLFNEINKMFVIIIKDVFKKLQLPNLIFSISYDTFKKFFKKILHHIFCIYYINIKVKKTYF